MSTNEPEPIKRILRRYFPDLCASAGPPPENLRPSEPDPRAPTPETEREAQNMWLNALLETTLLEAGWPPTARRRLSGRPLRPLLTFEGFCEEWSRAPRHESEGAHRALGDEGGWLAICGNEGGEGKTSLTYHLGLCELEQWAMAKTAEGEEGYHWNAEVFERERPRHHYTEWRRLIQEEKSRFRHPSLGSPFRALEDVDLLVLDDIPGDMTTGGWEQQMLETLLGRRYSNLKRTIMVCRCSNVELEGVLGRTTYSRFCERGTSIPCNWTPYR